MKRAFNETDVIGLDAYECLSIIDSAEESLNKKQSMCKRKAAKTA